MTDKELIALVEMKLPQELSLDEIELIRERMRASPIVRRALAAQLEMDQYLAGLIGKVEMSPEAIIARANRAGRFRRASILTWLGWTSCLLLVGCGVSLFVWLVFIRTGDRGAELAKGDGKANVTLVKKPELPADDIVASEKTDEADTAAANGAAKMHAGESSANGAKQSGSPAAVVAAAPRRDGVIAIPAANVSRMERLTVDRTEYGRGIGVLVGDHGWAEFDVVAPKAGLYRLELCYAAAESRPLRLKLNGVVVKERVAVEITGNWFPEGQRQFPEGDVSLRQGKNKLRLESDGMFPHLSLIMLVPAKGQTNVTVKPARPAFPWLTDDNLGTAPRTMEEIAFDQFDLFDSSPSLDDMRRWFRPIENGHLDMRDYYGGRIATIDGKLRLEAPLSEDTVLRLSLYESQWLALHFWRGEQGLTLRTYDNKGAIVAYATSGSDRNRPTRVLAATDDERNWRTNPPLWPMRLDIRFHKGLMVVSRGDLELLRAPFTGVPQDVFFEGHSLVRGIALVRTTSELTDEPSPRPVVADIQRPADLKWESQLPKGVTLKKLDDGSIALRADQSPQPGWMAVALPGGGLGLNEVIVEVDDLTPGSNVGLGSLQNDPKPKATVGFMRDNNSGGLSFRWNGYGDASLDFGVDYNGGMGAANAARHFWLKFVGGCGLKCYTSIDGRHWARMLQPLDSPPVPFTHLACWLPQGNQAREIRVRRITVRKLDAVESLAPPPEIMSKAPTLAISDFANWEAEVAKHKPADIGASAWRRACALKTLAGGGPASAMRPLVEQLADEAVALPGSAADQIKRLDELALLNDVWGDGGAAGRFMHHYAEIGQRLQREGDAHPWSMLASAVARSPLWCVQQYPLGLERLARAELLETVYAGDQPAVDRVLARVRIANLQEPLLAWATDWAAAHGGTEPAPERNAPRIERRHPFIEELNKEGFNLLGDFESAMASKAYRDACQIVTSSDASETLGLWPDSRDPQLLVSINGAIDLAMAHDSQLRQTMIREFGPIGMLQLRQAMNESDGSAVAAVVARYRGTDAAAQADLWLGDRAVSTGDFARARSYYAHARRTAGHQASIAAMLAPRERLAAAMMGDDLGQPIIAPVALGDVQLSASDFEGLVAEMRKAHAPAAANDHASVSPADNLAIAPVPSGFELREIGRVDGELGDNPSDFGGLAPSRDQNTILFQGQRDKKRFVTGDTPIFPITRGIDWPARQLAFSVDGEMAYVSNRFQVAAFDLKEGRRTRQSGIGGEHARTHDWTLTAMRPLVVGDRIFTRRLVKTGPELAALQKSDGHVTWRTRTGLLVVSDPLWIEHRLIALTLSQSDQQSILYLSTFDSTSGMVVAQERLATLRDTWRLQRTCQLSAVKEGLVAVFGGTVLACDRSGKTRWVRRQEWISPQDDRDWARQTQALPIVWQDRLFVTQPGVAAVECIDAESGELAWRKVFPGLMRMLGVADNRLIVQTQSGLVALAADKGNPLWFHDVGDLLEGQLCGGPGKLLYTRREKVPGNDNLLRPVLVWLDPADGHERATFPLDSLRHDHPMFGPFLTSGEKLFAFAAGGENEPVRILYELTPKVQAAVNRNSAAARLAGAPHGP
jgi:outer membrane protein assembly factor BamB